MCATAMMMMSLSSLYLRCRCVVDGSNEVWLDDDEEEVRKAMAMALAANFVNLLIFYSPQEELVFRDRGWAAWRRFVDC